ncbi:hypothetical protein BVC80_8951g11 [Macleaya cordata]|uniref:Proton pump-interactor n=1 Tax=Macleaya cordata TaxID=56857 RepID=A0A200QWU6_MACCD|nr:hypothetical protein BVC80_8951g11 [Macleaya cordata]
MGVEVVDADFPSVPVKDGNEEGITNHELGFCEFTEFRPKDSVNEWLKPKQIHTFYFIKYPSYENPKLKSKFEKAEKKYQKSKQASIQITEAVKEKERKKFDMISELRYLPYEQMRYKDILDEKRNRMDYLHQALVNLRNEAYTSREKGVDLCSSEEELNYLIRSLHFQMQRGCNTLVEEKQLLRAIQQLEETREKVIANAAQEQNLYWRYRGYRDTYKYSWKQDYRDWVNNKPMDLDGVRKEKQLISDRIKYLKERGKAICTEMSSLQVKLTAINRRKNAAYDVFLELENQLEKWNADYDQNCFLLNNARELATKKNIAALEELSRSEVEKFMSLWSSSKDFRDDYVNRIPPSLDSRQLSRDGRMRNPGEKPLVSEFPSASELETVSKLNVKQPKEDFKPHLQPENLSNVSIMKVQKRDSQNLTLSDSTVKDGDELLEVKLKEMKREEEIAEAKEALERKKKLAEKAAAKAVPQTHKGAEKKLREHEKRSKKKRATITTASHLEEQNESDVVVVELENSNVKIKAPIPSRSNELKENTTRYRNRPKHQNLVPKAPKLIIKRNNSISHHTQWVALVASLVAMLLALGYYYLL